LPDDRLQRWAWWPLLPLYPYGHRPTLMRELIAGQVWCFEQLHGVWYVAVPIRMTVLKVEGGLLLYAPLPPTAELLLGLRALEEQHGPVVSIVLATSSGLEHKLPLAPLARAFPTATVWVSDHQWSFPLPLPSLWLGFPAGRTKVLFRDGVPHQDQLVWLPLGPINLGLGTFYEIACLDRISGALLVTDALVSISATPPEIFDLDPAPLLFHGREKGSEAMIDTPEQRLKGWKRIVLFANFFRPESVSIAAVRDLLSDAGAATEANPRNHFALYPFRWAPAWEDQADQMINHGLQVAPCRLAPVLERLVFVRAKKSYVDWLRTLAKETTIKSLVSAHYSAPQSMNSDSLDGYADHIEATAWAPSDGSWQLLAAIDRALIRWRIVPS
jgi:hypothetical protein